MGAPQNFLLDSLKLKGIVLGNKGSFSTTTSSSNLISSSSLWTEKLRQTRKKQMHLRKNKRVLMKRRSRSMIRRRNENGIERKVQTLKRLIPSRESNQGLDGLFRDTASYIMSLQMRVRVMQIMVDVLATTQAHDE